jgi:hypothetical protein
MHLKDPSDSLSLYSVTQRMEEPSPQCHLTAVLQTGGELRAQGGYSFLRYRCQNFLDYLHKGSLMLWREGLRGLAVAPALT